MAEKTRQEYIHLIMEKKYGDDHPKYDGQNISFLESLTDEELQALYDEVLNENV